MIRSMEGVDFATEIDLNFIKAVADTKKAICFLILIEK
jgi:hypothetical protein